MIKKMELILTVELEKPVHIGKTIERHIDLTALLPADIPGVIDEYSFDMFEITGGAKERTLVQFMSDVQKRIPAGTQPVRPIKPSPPNGTIPRAFTSAPKYCCETQGRQLTRCSGTLTWLLSPGESLSRSFLLTYDLVQQGEFIQLSPAPHSFVVFYPDGRIPRRAQYPSAEILPHITPDCKISSHIDGELVATYNYGKDYDKPYFYPLIGPSGVGITTVGKPHDPTDSHRHHKSFWVAHQRINGVNFWEEWPDNGKIVHQGFDALVTGPLFPHIRERNTWERGARVHAYETRSFQTYKTPGGFRYIDVEIVMEPESAGRFAGDLHIGSTVWGFLAIRLRESMTPLDNGGEIRNSNGQLNEHDVIWESAAWCDISGPINAREWNGAAIFDNPGNFGFPCGWQCRNDGFICTSSFNKDDLIVKVGEKLVIRHRLFLHKGNADEGRVAQAYEDYTSPYRVDIR